MAGMLDVQRTHLIHVNLKQKLPRKFYFRISVGPNDKSFSSIYSMNIS